MLLNLLFGGDILQGLMSFAIIAPILLFSLCVHEASHALAANLLGDSTAKNMGRLTLNPIRHLDLMGTLALVLLGFGWAKPVPININNFKNRKVGMALSAGAGPLSNLLMCLVFAQLSEASRYLPNLIPNDTLAIVLIIAFFYAAIINAVLAVFNLIPVPPFDGSRLAYVFLPDKAYFGLMRYERYIMYGLIGVLLLLNILRLPSPIYWLGENIVWLFTLWWPA